MGGVLPELPVPKGPFAKGPLTACQAGA